MQRIAVIYERVRGDINECRVTFDWSTTQPQRACQKQSHYFSDTSSPYSNLSLALLPSRFENVAISDEFKLFESFQQ